MPHLRPWLPVAFALVSVAAACDRGRPAPDGGAPSHRHAAGARAPVAIGPQGPRCPAGDFAAFVGRFAEDAGVQQRFTRIPLEVADFEYGLDEQGRDASSETVRRLGRVEVRWPPLPLRAGRAADSLALRVEAAGARPRAVLYRPDSDYQIVYVFEPTAGCWELVRVEDRSL